MTAGRDDSGRFSREGKRAKLPPHGTRARYQHRTEPCHCGACTEANTKAVAEWRSKHGYDRGVVPMLDEHGTVLGEQFPLPGLDP